MLKAYHQINSQPEVVLSNNAYNELGQLVDKSIHSVNGAAYLQSVDFRYTIQGRLSRMNSATATDPGDPDDYFGFEVAYENTFTSGAGTLNTQRFDGAITGLKWRNTLPQLSTSKVKEKGYAYGYNNLGWLTSSAYKENTFNDPASTWNAGLGRYDEKGLTYDYNGNIQALDRYTKSFISGSYVSEKIDQLGYVYGAGGNQLMKVAENLTSGNKQLGFKDATNTDNDYAYDINGNLTLDKNKGITAITYNFQNLTDRVTFSDNSYIQYTYDAGGSKLRQWAYNNLGQPVTKTDYVGELLIVNDQVKFVDHEEGRLVMPDNSNLVANTIRDANSLEGYTASQNVTLTSEYLNTQTYVKAVCNQATSTPGVWPIGGTAGVYNVKQGESYSLMMLGYQSVGTSAKLYVWGTVGDLVWTGSFNLPVGSANENYVTANFTVPTGVTQIKVGVLWSSPAVGHTIYINQVKLFKADLEYQYFLTDQVGSPRVVLGTTPAIATFAATMESDSYSTENTQWLNLNSSRYTIPPTMSVANATLGGDQSIMMNNEYRVGPARSMKVFPGDKVDANVMAYYGAASSLTQTTAGIMAAAVSTILTGGIGGGVDGAITQAYNTTGNPLISLSPFQGTTKPSAFLNYILFDENYIVLEAKSSPLGATAGVLHQVQLPQVSVREPGYLFVYLSYDNESTAPVYFDELKIIYQESPIVQVNNYYPYGLVATEWVRDGEIDNNFLFQGKELNDQTGLQDFGSRQYDGATGRWFAEDPAGQFGSPFLAMGNNPVMMTDPDGQWAGWDDAIVTAAGFAYGYVSSGIKTGDWGKKSVIQGAITAALFEIGYLTGGASAGLTAASSNTAIATAGASYAAQSIVTGSVGQFLPSVPIVESENFNLSVSPAFAWGTNGIQAGASLNASGRIGNTELSGSASGFATWKGFGSNAKGWNAQLGAGITQHNIAGTSLSYYSTTFKGSNKKFNQRVGGIGIQIGDDFSVRFEDDYPFGDMKDRYRTAAFQFQYRNYVAGFKVFTGDPDDGIGNRPKSHGGHRLAFFMVV